MTESLLTDIFDCPCPLGKARLSYRACLTLQGAATIHRGGKGDGHQWEQIVPVQPACQGCAKGAEVRAMFPEGVEVKARPVSQLVYGKRKRKRKRAADRRQPT